MNRLTNPRQAQKSGLSQQMVLWAYTARLERDGMNLSWVTNCVRAVRGWCGLIGAILNSTGDVEWPQIWDEKVTCSISKTWCKKAQNPLTRIRVWSLLLQPQVLLSKKLVCCSGGHTGRRSAHLRANLDEVSSLCSLRYLEAVKTKTASSLGYKGTDLENWHQWGEVATQQP